MKMISLFRYLWILTVVFSFVACSDDDDTTFIAPSNTISDFVSGNENFSMLLEALQKTGLDVTLNGAGTFTVFAPNNAAFTAFLNGATIADVSKETLEELLLNHVLGTTAISSSLSTGYVSTLAKESSSEGNVSMYISTEGGVTINGDATVVTADIIRDNGVIHEVDKVIALPTMLTFVALDSSLSTLATVATTTSGFDTDFAAVLGAADSKLTLLAPDNAAFAALGDISGLAASALEQILLNHVLTGVNVSSALSTTYSNTLATYGTTSNNLSIYINTADGVIFNGVSKVSTADIVTSNGVIHKVDTVVGLPTIVTFATADANFSELVASLTTDTPDTDFVSVLSTANGTNPAPFTVFAPTNDAFAALGDKPDDKDGALTAVLNHHVISGNNVRSTDLTDGPVATLNGNVTIDADVPTVTGGSNTTPSSIIAADVQAANGVIHVIDQVLLPAAAL